MPSMNVPFDLQGSQEEVDRKKMLAKLLQQQSMQMPQGQMVSGHYVGPGIGALMPLLQAYMGQKIGSEAATGQAEVASQQKNMLATELGNYFKTREGAPGQTLSTDQADALLNGDFDPASQLAEPVKADPRRAAIGALTSQLPQLQALGQSDLEAQNKAKAPRDFLSVTGADLSSRVAATQAGDASLLKPEQKAGDAQYSELMEVGRDAGGQPIMGQRNLATGEIKFQPRGQTINVDTGKKAGDAFATELAQARAKTITTSYETATSAAKALDALEAAEGDVEAGIKSGITSQVALGVSKFAKALGMEADPTIANTEAFRAGMARETLNLVKGLGAGTGISNADREFAEKASGGSILLDDKAITRLMAIAKAAASNVVMGHNRLLRRQEGATGTLPQDLQTFSVPLHIKGSGGLYYDQATGKFKVQAPKAEAAPVAMPAAPAAPASPGTMSVQDWLNK